MAEILKQLKNLIKVERFSLLFIVFILSLLTYLLVKSPTIKSTTDIQLDGAADSTTIQVDSLPIDTLRLDSIQ